MKKTISSGNKSNKKEISHKPKIISNPANKSKKVPTIRKHRPLISSISQYNNDEDRNLFQKSFCNANKKASEKKNSVLLTHIEKRKFSDPESNRKIIIKDSTESDLLSNTPETVEEKLDEKDIENDKKIDLLQNKIQLLFGLIDDFESKFIKVKNEEEIKKELYSIKKYSISGDSVSLDTPCNAKDDKKKINYAPLHNTNTNKIKNKSVDFATKTTMENSIVAQKKVSDKTEKKEKEGKNKLTYYKKKIEPRTIFTPTKPQVGKPIHFIQKKGIINSKGKLKNTSLCCSERNGYKKLNKLKSPNNQKNSDDKKLIGKETNIKRNGSPIKEAGTVKIFFPESINDEDQCKTERVKIKPDILKLDDIKC